MPDSRIYRLYSSQKSRLGNFFKAGGFDFVFSPETRIATMRCALPYDQTASGAIIYAYVGGNPVNAVDPLGLFGCFSGGCHSGAMDWYNPDPYQNEEIPKPPTGKGTASPDERDPVRLFPKDDKQECLDENGGKCEICGDDLDIDDAVGHHINRWADGGRTTKDNLAITCKPCHKKLHK